jgi:hypothetical protein
MLRPHLVLSNSNLLEIILAAENASNGFTYDFDFNWSLYSRGSPSQNDRAVKVSCPLDVF